MKRDVHDLVTKKFIKFDAWYDDTTRLGESVIELSQEMETVTEKIDSTIRGQLNISANEFQSLKGDLQEVTSVMKVVETLVEIGHLLELKDADIKENNFSKAVEHLQNANHLLMKDWHSDIKIIDALKTQHTVQREMLILTLGNKWSENVKWSMPDKTKESHCVLTLASAGSELKVIQEVIVAMEMMHQLDIKVKQFGKSFLERIIKPIVIKTDLQLTCKSEDDCQIITLTVEPKQIKSESRCLQVLQGVHSALKALFESIGKIATASNSDTTFMMKLGHAISAEAVDFIVKECLSREIPTDRKELKNFTTVLDAVNVFEKELLALGFTNASNAALRDYVQNVGVLFVNKKCQLIFEQAKRLITTTDIYSMVSANSERPIAEIPNLEPGPSGEKSRKVQIKSEVTLSSETFKLPNYQISSFVNGLIGLAYETLNESTSSQASVQIFYTVRNIFELYYTTFPLYHKKNLAELPQLTALHHNNCNYISRHLMTMGHQFKLQLPASMNATFIDLIYKLTDMGTTSFMKQLTRQKEQITTFLRQTEDYTEGERWLATKRSVNKCLLHMNHLQNVWQDVLPINIYRKSIGSLVNRMMSEMIDHVTALEDIASDDAQLLHDIFSLVLEKLPPLFSTPSDGVVDNFEILLQKNVTSGRKFKELHLLLNASLSEINDRWAENKGPLALDFSPNEMKQLIRALFQNTDRRALVLSKIK